MKNLFLLLSLAWGYLTVVAQPATKTFTPYVLSNYGAGGSAGSYQIDGTGLQTMVGIGQSESYLFTQGFHQTGLPLAPDGLPRYNLEEIPDQTAYWNVETAFYVYAEALGTGAELAYQWKGTEPSGQVRFHPQSGKFTIVPNERDRGKYPVTFRARLNGREYWQEVDIYVVPQLPPEQTAFGLEPVRDLPKEDDDDFVIFREAKNTEEINFNHGNRKTRNISIAGKTLVFDKQLSNKLNALSTITLSDIEELNLYAETVIIRSALHFPQTDITIHARKLIFENGSEFGSINTQPRVNGATQNEGAHGLQAGSITLHLQRFTSDAGNRFRLIGGAGQKSLNKRGGNGGRGGSISSTKPVQFFTDIVGGAAGDGRPCGNKGPAGAYNSIDKTHSWLHPFALRMVVNHAKVAYLNGYMNYTQRTFEDYIAEIEAYKASSEWLEIPEEDRAELDQMQSEMETILHRIGNNLDYFGNPAGWVPMLSFEVQKIAFEEEIDRAMRVLYLAYWIQEANAGAEKKIQALGEAKQEFQQVLIDYQKNYEEAVKLLPELEEEADEITAEIANIQQKIEELEDELTDRAQYIVEERHKPPKRSWWRKVARTVGTIAQVVPFYQPVLGTIGTGLTTLSELDINKPLEAISTVKDVVMDFKDAKYKASAENFKTEMKKLDPSQLATTNVGELRQYYENLRSTAEPIYKAVSELRTKVGKTAAPLEEIRVELDRLKAESLEYAELIAQTDNLMTQKAQFQQKITVTLQKIASLSSNIQVGVLAADGLNGEIFETYSKRDLRALLYVDDMERRARERLIKYHYYMAKAFEYRLLTPYTRELDLANRFNSIQTMIERDDDPHLTEAEFNQVKAIYDDVISSVTEEILTRYNQNAPEISAPLRFKLSQEDLDLLNAGYDVNLNMVERGIFPAYEENIRIRGFRVDTIIAHYENGRPGQWAYSDLLLEHSGISKLKKDSEVYLFNHYNNENRNRISWGMRFDAYDGLVNPKEPSLYHESMLRSLLEGLERYSSENLALYSRPAAWADIIITKNDNTSNGVRIVFDEVRLEIIYDFQQRPASQVNIEVSTNHGMRPLIRLSRPDKNERQDGWGSFIRTYHKNRNATITLEAPAEYGSWVFDEWTDFNGNFLSDEPVLHANLGADQLVRANYLLIQPVLAVEQDTVYLPETAGEETIAIRNAGSGDMYWNARENSEWIKLQNHIGNDGSTTLNYDANGSGAERISYIEVIAPESIDYRDTIVVIQSIGNIVNRSEDNLLRREYVKIYPNPTRDIVTIELEELFDSGFLTIQNSFGSEVLSMPISQGLITLNLGEFPRGVYYLRVRVDDNSTVKKIFVQ